MSLFSVTLFVLVRLRLFVSEFTPSTDSNWSSFTCFNETQLSEYGVSEMFEIGRGIDLLFDDWGLSSLAAAIIMKEVLHYNVLLSSYSDSNTIDIVTNSSHIASALEIYPNYLNTSDIYHYSVDNALFIDQQLGVQAFTSWYIPNTFIDHIHKLHLNSTLNNDEIWLDFWKTYTLPQITNELLDINQLQSLNLTINTQQHLYNDTCTDYNQCNILLIRDLNYDLSSNQQIINDNNLSFALKYIPKQHLHLFSNQFVVYSLSSPSSLTNSHKFTPISLPSTQMTLIHKFIPNILAIVSSFGFDLLQSLKMTNSDYNLIYKHINHTNEDTNDRLQAVCAWLKSPENNKWLSWIPDATKYAHINCGLYSDTELANLLYLRNITHINSTLTAQFIELSHTSSFTDLHTAIRVSDACISIAKKYPNSLLVTQIMAMILMFVIIICAILVILSRGEVIIIAGSYPLLLLFLFGGCIGCLVPIFGYPFISYYICEVLCVHTTIILMFGSLIGKSWRLQKIIINAKRGKVTEITTGYILLRIVCICAIIWIYWAVTISSKLGEISAVNDVFDGVLYDRVIMHNDTLCTLIPLIFEFAFILWGSRIAWNLRSVNPQFNESKHIAVILYHTFFIVLLIAILFLLLSINAHVLRLLWMAVWLLMIAFAVCVLMVPKFTAIYNGVEYFDKGLVDRQNSNKDMWIPKELSSEQVQQLTRVLRKLGFKVQREASGSRSPYSSSNILKKRNVRKFHSASVGIEDLEYQYQETVNNGHGKLALNKKNSHLRTRSALPTIIQTELNEDDSNDSVVIHGDDSEADSGTKCVSSLSHHKNHAATVLGLPPPASWDYDEEAEEEDMVPLPSSYVNRRLHKKRSATLPERSPLSVMSIEPVMSMSPVSEPQSVPDMDEKAVAPAKQTSVSVSRVTDIIAKFNNINVQFVDACD